MWDNRAPSRSRFPVAPHVRTPSADRRRRDCSVCRRRDCRPRLAGPIVRGAGSRDRVRTARTRSPRSPLSDQDGKPLDATFFTRGWTLVFFGFTRCPDVCPTTLATLARTRATLTDLPTGQQPRVLLVSVDPEHDQASLLADYVRHFDPSFHAATGDPTAVATVAAGFGVPYAKVAPGAGRIYRRPRCRDLFRRAGRHRGVLERAARCRGAGARLPASPHAARDEAMIAGDAPAAGATDRAFAMLQEIAAPAPPVPRHASARTQHPASGSETRRSGCCSVPIRRSILARLPNPTRTGTPRSMRSSRAHLRPACGRSRPAPMCWSRRSTAA